MARSPYAGSAGRLHPSGLLEQWSDGIGRSQAQSTDLSSTARLEDVRPWTLRQAQKLTLTLPSPSPSPSPNPSPSPSPSPNPNAPPVVSEVVVATAAERWRVEGDVACEGGDLAADARQGGGAAPRRGGAHPGGAAPAARAAPAAGCARDRCSARDCCSARDRGRGAPPPPSPSAHSSHVTALPRRSSPSQ